MADDLGVYETPSEGLTSDSGDKQEISEKFITTSTESMIPDCLSTDNTKKVNIVNKRNVLDRSPESENCTVDSVSEPDPKKRPIVESVGAAVESVGTA